MTSEKSISEESQSENQITVAHKKAKQQIWTTNLRNLVGKTQKEKRQ
jgi:hypothetical protein